MNITEKGNNSDFSGSNSFSKKEESFPPATDVAKTPEAPPVQTSNSLEQPSTLPASTNETTPAPSRFGQLWNYASYAVSAATGAGIETAKYLGAKGLEGTQWATKKGLEGTQWAAKKATDTAITTTTNQLKGALFHGTGYTKKWYDQKLNQEKATLKNEGGLVFLKAVSSLSKLITDQLDTLVSHEALKSVVQTQKGELEKLLNLTMLKVIKNVANSVSLEDEKAPSDLVSRFMIGLFHLANKHSPRIDAELAEIESISDPVEKATRLGYLFRPLADDFFKIALPNGRQDLDIPPPLNTIVFEILKAIFMQHPQGLNDVDAIYPLNRLIWNYVIPNVSPYSLVSLYHQIRDPMKAAEANPLLETEKGQRIAEVCKIIREQASHVIPHVIADQSRTIATEVAAKLVPASNEDKQSVQNTIKTWLSCRIQTLAATEHPDVVKIWQFSGRYIESILLQTFLQLSQDNDKQDVAVTLTEKLLSKASPFFKENHAMLAEKIANAKKDPAVEAELEKHFQPLAKDLLATMGWDTPDTLPIPHFLQGIIGPMIEKELPKLLLSLYRDLTVPQVSDQGKRETLEGVELATETMHAAMDQLMPAIKEAIVASDQGIAEGTVAAIDAKLVSMTSKDTSIKELISKEDQSMLTELLKGSIKDLAESKNPAVTDAFSFMQTYLEKLTIQLMVNLADGYPSLDPQNDRKDILSHAALNLLHIAAKHLKGIDATLIEDIQEYDAMPEGAAKEKAKKALLEKFAPASKAILKATALNDKKTLPIPKALQAPLIESLEDSVVPNLLLRLYRDLLVVNPRSEEEQTLLQEMEGADKLAPIGKAISASLIPLIKKELKDSGKTIAKQIDKNFSLSKEKQRAFAALHLEVPAKSKQKTATDSLDLAISKEILALESETLPSTSSPHAKMVGKSVDAIISHLTTETTQSNSLIWNFVQHRIEKLVTGGLEKLALSSNADEGDNALVNILKNLFSMTGKNIEEFNPRFHSQLKKIKNLPEGKVKDKSLEKLAKEFIPLSKELLKAAGIEKAEDLPVPFFLKNTLWKTLNDSLLPQLLMKLYGDIAIVAEPNKKTTGTLKEIAEVAAENLIPTIKEQLLKKEDEEAETSVAAQKIHTLLAKNGVTAIDAESIDTVITHVVTSKDPEVKQAWGFVQKYTEKLLLHMLSNLAGEEQKTSQIVATILNTAEKYFKEHSEDIDAKVQLLLSMHPEKNKEQCLIQLFTEEAIEIAGLNEKNTFPHFIEDSLLNALKTDILPPLFYDIYCDITNPQKLQNKYHDRLNELLFKEVKDNKGQTLAITGSSTDDIPKTLEEAKDIIWQTRGTLEAAKQIEGTCSLLAGDIRSFARNYVKDEAKNIAKNLNDLLPVKKLENKQLGWLTDLIRSIGEDENVVPESTWKYLETIAETGLLKVLVHVAEASPPIEGKPALNTLGTSLTIRLLSVLDEHRKEISVLIKEARKIKNPELRQKRLREIFAPVAKDLLQIGKSDAPLTLKDLPVPEPLKEVLWDAIQNKLVPDLLEKMYTDTTAWEDAIHEEKGKLHKIFEAKHPEYFCNALSQYVKDYLPFYLSSSHKDVGGAIFNAFKGYLDKKDLADPTIKDKVDPIRNYLAAHQTEITSMLGENIQAIGENTEETKETWEAVENYVNAALIRVFRGFSGNIQSIESDEEKNSFLANPTVMLSLLKIVTEHFNAINDVTTEQKKSKAYKVPDDIMLARFKELHLGVPKEINSAKTPEEIDKIRLEHFYVPLTEKILDLSNLKEAKDLKAVPEQFREQVWNILKKDMLPDLIKTLYKNLLDPSTLNSMFLNSLEALNEALDSVPETLAEEEGQDDPEQREINKQCGELVKSLVGLLPNSFTNVLFTNIAVVNKATAEALGKSIRKSLGDWSILKIIDKGLTSGLPALHPGHWTGTPGNEKFVPDKQADGVTGEMKFSFPKTEAEKIADLKKKKADDAAVLKKLKAEIVKTISTRTKKTLHAYVLSLWGRFQKSFDTFVDKHFGAFGLKIKGTLDHICRKIFFDMLGAFLSLLFYPVHKLGSFFIDLYLSKKADEIIKDMHMKIHENLIFKLSDDLVGRLHKKHIKQWREEELKRKRASPKAERQSLKTAEVTKKDFERLFQTEPAKIDLNEIRLKRNAKR